MAAVESESKSEPYNLLVESVKDAVQDSMHGDYARQHASVENGIEPDVIPANQSQGWTVNSSFFVRLQTRVRSGNGWTPWKWQGVHLNYFYQNNNGVLVRQNCPNGDGMANCSAPSITKNGRFSCTAINNVGRNCSQSINCRTKWALDASGYVQVPSASSTQFAECADLVSPDLIQKAAVSATGSDWVITVETRKTTSSPWLQNTLSLNAAYANINGFITRRQNGDMCQSSRDPSISSEYILSCECRKNDGEWDQQQIHLLNVVSLDSEGSVIWPPPMHAVHSLLGPHEQLHGNSIYVLEFMIRGNLCRNWSVTASFDPLYDFLINVQTRKNTSSPWLRNALGLNAVYANLNGIITQANNGNMCLSSGSPLINGSSGVFSCLCQQSNGRWNSQSINLKRVLLLNSDGYAVWPSGWSDAAELKEDYVSKKEDNVAIDDDAKEVEQFVPLDLAIPGSLEQNWSVSSSGVISVQTRKTTNGSWLNNSLNLSGGYANDNGVMVRRNGGAMCLTSKDYAINSSSGAFSCQCKKRNGKWKSNSMNMRAKLVLDPNGYAAWP